MGLAGGPVTEALYVLGIAAGVFAIVGYGFLVVIHLLYFLACGIDQIRSWIRP